MFTIRDGREHFYTWDLDRQIIVDDPGIVEVHFCNRTDECSLVVEVKDEDGLRVANVPNIILQKSFDVRVFGYDGKATRFDKVFKVKPRTKPADYVYTETEVKNFETLEKQLNERLDKIEEGVTVDLTGYATEEYVDEAIEPNKCFYLDVNGCEIGTSYRLTDEMIALIEHFEKYGRAHVFINYNQTNTMGSSGYVPAKIYRFAVGEYDIAPSELDSGALCSGKTQRTIGIFIASGKYKLTYQYGKTEAIIATRDYVDTAIAATPKAAYLNFSTLTADARTATEEEAAIFERLYTGEQILVNIRPNGRDEYLPSGYRIIGNTVRFIYNRVSHSGSGVNTGDNRIAIDAAWYRAQRAGDGTWTVWQSSGCRDVVVATQQDITELEDAIAAIEVSGGGSGGGANVYTLDFSDVTETVRDATLVESAVLDKILARENLVLYITKNNISMPAEITYRSSNSLNLNYTRVRHRTGENISLTSIFYRAYYDGAKWTLNINDYYEDLMVASQDWVRAQFDGIATAEGGAY